MPRLEFGVRLPFCFVAVRSRAARELRDRLRQVLEEPLRHFDFLGQNLLANLTVACGRRESVCACRVPAHLT